MEEPTPVVKQLLSDLSSDPPTLSPMWFYDAVGSALFETITRLPSYYLTRSELQILESSGENIANALGSHTRVIELGSGSAAKASALLRVLDAPAGYHPIDVSPSALAATVSNVQREFPALEVRGLAGNFHSESDMRRMLDTVGGRETLVLFFPGSTIGNFEPDKAEAFLSRIARAAPEGSAFLIGIDLIKDAATLRTAYDDPAGVTAAFNRNALLHINRRTGSTFDARKWSHASHWNEREKRVEMWLTAEEKHEVHIAGSTFTFEKGDRIHTENSYKWTIEAFTTLAAKAGWLVSNCWTDDEKNFAQVLLWNDEKALRR